MSAGVVGRARASHLLQGSAWILVGLGIQAVLGPVVEGIPGAVLVIVAAALLVADAAR